jgi:glycosyltransferase involved in cell wall biosynthesis
MHKRNVVFITPSFKTGGGNRVFIELANEICHKMDVLIIYPNNSPDKHTFAFSDSIYVKAIGTLATSKLSRLKNLVKCILYLKKNHKDDIVIISDPIFSIFIFLFGNANLYRFIQADDYSIYDDGLILGEGTILKIYKFLCRWSYKQKNNFIFNSKYTYEQYLKYSNKNVSYKLVHPAINHSVFKRKEIELNRSKITICLIARKHPWKGLITFINVFNSFTEEVRNNLKVTLISHDDLSSFNISDMNIVKPTSDEEIADVYNNSDIFISTSWWEGFGLPPLEAMACGCAVITSRSGGVDEYAIDNNNCLMYAPKNEKELTEQIIKLIFDKNLRHKLSSNGIITAKTFSWEKSAKQLMKIIKL